MCIKTICPNVDECNTGTHDCDINAACTDTECGFICQCNSGYRGNGTSCTFKIVYQDLGEQDKTWTEVKDICDNLSDGGYRMPTPDSQEYHDAIVALATDDVAIGFSDDTEEGNWINVYTGTNNITKLL